MTNQKHPSPIDFVRYLSSINQELVAVKDRVRSLVRHWPTDGHFKEAILRQLMRRHLPETAQVGTGFIIGHSEASTEVDVLVTNKDMPTLFKDGELLMVTPEAVSAVIEVKTKVSKSKLEATLTKLAKQKSLVIEHCKSFQRHGEPEFVDPWAGLFVYEGDAKLEIAILNLLYDLAQSESQIDAVCFGPKLLISFIRYPEIRTFSGWHSFHSKQGLAAASFVGEVIRYLKAPPQLFGGYPPYGEFAWTKQRGTLLHAMPSHEKKLRLASETEQLDSA